MNNCSGISPLLVTTRLFQKLFRLGQRNNWIHNWEKYQEGFRKVRWFIEQIMNLKSIFSGKNKKFVVSFVDFEKAYKPIDRTTLIQILEELS